MQSLQASLRRCLRHSCAQRSPSDAWQCWTEAASTGWGRQLATRAEKSESVGASPPAFPLVSLQLSLSLRWLRAPAHLARCGARVVGRPWRRAGVALLQNRGGRQGASSACASAAATALRLPCLSAQHCRRPSHSCFCDSGRRVAADSGRADAPLPGQGAAGIPHPRAGAGRGRRVGVAGRDKHQAVHHAAHGACGQPRALPASNNPSPAYHTQAD